MFAGTDAGSVLPHGLVVDELHELAAAGLPRTAALDAALLGGAGVAGPTRGWWRARARTCSSSTGTPARTWGCCGGRGSCCGGRARLRRLLG